jgi:hypothetical protein
VTIAININAAQLSDEAGEREDSDDEDTAATLIILVLDIGPDGQRLTLSPLCRRSKCQFATYVRSPHHHHHHHHQS